MTRKNIFALINDNWSYASEVDRIIQLFSKSLLLQTRDGSRYSVVTFFDRFCFPKWKSRGHSIDVNDFLNQINYNNIVTVAKVNMDDFLTLIELVMNFWIIVKRFIDSYDSNAYIDNDYIDQNFYLLYKIMIDDLEKVNYKYICDKNNEQVLIIEDKPEVTAVVEIVPNDLALKILRYNHHAIKGDIESKKSILLAMGSGLEPKRSNLQSICSSLTNDIFYMLNNLNIRHNNKDKRDTKNYQSYVDNMRDNDLEDSYDDLYQMMLLASLELDQVERSKRCKDLKNKIEGTI